MFSCCQVIIIVMQHRFWWTSWKRFMAIVTHIRIYSNFCYSKLCYSSDFDFKSTHNLWLRGNTTYHSNKNEKCIGLKRFLCALLNNTYCIWLKMIKLQRYKLMIKRVKPKNSFPITCHLLFLKPTSRVSYNHNFTS